MNLPIEALREGYPIRRDSDPFGEFTYMQVPATIPATVIPKMTSVPPVVKALMATREGQPFNYHDQIVRVAADGSVTYRAFTHEDILANDWQYIDEHLTLIIAPESRP